MKDALLPVFKINQKIFFSKKGSKDNINLKTKEWAGQYRTIENKSRSSSGVHSFIWTCDARSE